MAMEVTIAALSFVVFVVVKLYVFHFRDVTNRFRSIVRALVIAALVDLAAMTLLPAQFDAILATQMGRLSAVLVSLCVLVGLFIAYVPCYYIVAASVSVRTLISVGSAPASGVEMGQFTGEGPLRRMLAHRLESMVRSGNLVRTDHGFRLTPKGTVLAIVAKRLKELWRIGPGG